MTKNLTGLVLMSVMALGGCRYFHSEASLQIQALSDSGKPLSGANVMVNKEQVGTTDQNGQFKGNLSLPSDEPILVEVSKPSTDTFYAPFFETITAKHGDVNTFKLKATLYGVTRDTPKTAALPDTEAPAAEKAAEAPAADQPQTIDIADDTPKDPATETEAKTIEAKPAPEAAPAEAGATGRPLTFYVVSGRDAVENAAIYYGDSTKKQWVKGCYSNTNGRCSFRLPEGMDTAVILARAKGFQTQSRTFQLMDGDRVRFEMNRGRSLEVFAITPNQANMEGVEGVRVTLNGKPVGATDRFGSLIAPMAPEDLAGGKVALEAERWLPSKAEYTLNPQSQESIIQHFQSVKPFLPKIALMDFITYRNHAGQNLLSAPTLEGLTAALAQAGASVANGPALNGKLAAQKLSLNDLSASTWTEVKKINETLHYIVRPSFIEGPDARIILSAIDLSGRMVYSTSLSVKAKGSTQAVLSELSQRLVQNLRHEGAVTEALQDEFRINLGQSHGLKTGDRVQITGNLRLPNGEISAWDAIASAVVTEAGANSSRIRLQQTQPNSRVEPGNSVAIERRSLPTDEALTLAVTEDQSKGPIGLAEVYDGDHWLGSSDLKGQALIPVAETLKSPNVHVYSPGYTPAEVPLFKGQKSLMATLAHDAIPVQIETSPTGALVKINGRDLGRTPIDTEIPYPGPSVIVEVGGVDGYERVTRTQAVGARGIILREDTALTLHRDPIQAAKIYVSEGRVNDAEQLLEAVPDTEASYPLAQHMVGELYLNQTHDPVKAATAFHKVTSQPDVESFKDKRFIGSFINEAVALFQAGEQAAVRDQNLAISYWRQCEAILNKTEDQLRYVPQAQYPQAVHTLSYYRALSLHKTWTLTQNAEDQAKATQHWKDYIEGTALAIPQDQRFDWVKKAEGYFKQIQTARSKPRDARSPVAM